MSDSKMVKLMTVLAMIFAFTASVESIYIRHINRELDKAKTEIKQQASTINYLQKEQNYLINKSE